MPDKKKIGAWFEKSTAKTLKNFCEAREVSVSSFLRRSAKKELAKYSYLSDHEKKALGVKEDA